MEYCLSTRTSIARSSCSRDAGNGTPDKESGKSDWRIIPTTIVRKSVYDERTYGPDQWASRKSEFFEWFKRISGSRFSMQRKIITRPRFTGSILSIQGMPSRDQSLRLEREQQGISGNVSDDPFASVSHSWGKSATYGDRCSRDRQNQMSHFCAQDMCGRHPPGRYDGSVFAGTSTGKPVAKNEDLNQDTIPTPRLVNRPAAGHSNSP